MAGQGPAPAENRRRRNEPARGEWVDLDPLETPVLPNLPKRAKGTGSWSARTRAAWKAWREDPVTSQYGPAEIQNAIDLAFLYEDWVRGVGEPNEVRQWLDRLGLNAKGKRDLRWRLKSAEAAPKRSRPKRSSSGGRRARLSVVK